MEEENYSFDVVEHIKTSTPRSPYTRIDIAAYEPDSSICPLACLKAYINKTKDLRKNETKLFISYVRLECMSYGCINALKSHGISAFWSCDRIGKLNETYL